MSANIKTILLVDDEPVVREALGDVLTLHGYDVMVSEDYYTALQASKLHNGRIDLLLTDIALPGLNGCELARKLVSYRPELKVLLISGYTGSEICQYYRVQLGDLHFLAKPFTPAELLQRLEVLAAATEPYPASLKPPARTLTAGSGKRK